MIVPRDNAARLDFEPPRLDDFPCLGLAYQAGRAGGTYPTVLSAADEVAVALFRQNLKIASRDPPRGPASGPAIAFVVTKRWLAQSLAELGSFEAAIAAGREGLHVAELRNHPYSLTNALLALGIVYLMTAKPASLATALFILLGAIVIGLLCAASSWTSRPRAS